MTDFFNPYFPNATDDSANPCGKGIYQNDSTTIQLSGSGTVCEPLTGNVNISNQPGNSIVALSDGLFASSSATGISTGSYNSFTASYFIDSASFTNKISNVYASESNYTTNASFTPFSSSYVGDSSSLLTKITNATYNPTQLNLFSASLLTFTGSVNTQLTNIYASESNYTTTASFNNLSSSIVNIYASESNYFLTSSLKGANGRLAFFSGSSILTGSVISQVNNDLFAPGNIIVTGSILGGVTTGGTATNPAVGISTGRGMFSPGSSFLNFSAGSNVDLFSVRNAGGVGVAIGNGSIYGWVNTALPAALTSDTGLYRNTASVVEVNNGTAGVFGSLKAFIKCIASTGSQASINLPSGSAPTSPVDGDIWLDATGSLKIRISGQTKTFTLT